MSAVAVLLSSQALPRSQNWYFHSPNAMGCCIFVAADQDISEEFNSYWTSTSGSREYIEIFFTIHLLVPPEFRLYSMIKKTVCPSCNNTDVLTSAAACSRCRADSSPRPFGARDAAPE